MSPAERIIVTGGAGFIGSNFARRLQESGYQVLVLDDLSAGIRENLPPQCEFYKVDICDETIEKYFEGVSHVFHLAAKNCLADCAANPVETARINVMGSANVLRASVKHRVPHLVYADSSAEYEGIEEFPSRVERVRPLSVYACSKRGGALLCEALSRLHPIKITTVRYFNVYGPAQDWRRTIPPIMSAITMKLLRRESPTIYGTGRKRRDFIHVDDVNAFHLQLLREPDIWGGTYNLGSGKEYSMLDIFDLIEGEIHSGVKPNFQPELPMEAERTLADISRTLETGWSPQITVERGLKEFIQYTCDRLGMVAC